LFIHVLTLSFVLCIEPGENPSINTHLKRKSGGDDGVIKSRPPKKQKKHSLPENVIEINSDSDELRAGPSTLKGRSEANAIAGPSTRRILSPRVENSSQTLSSAAVATSNPASPTPLNNPLASHLYLDNNLGYIICSFL
jgi:hypothetical protein